MASATNSVPPPTPQLVRSNAVLPALAPQGAPVAGLSFANFLGSKLTENEKTKIKFSRGGRGSKRSKRGSKRSKRGSKRSKRGSKRSKRGSKRSKRNRSKRSGRK